MRVQRWWRDVVLYKPYVENEVVGRKEEEHKHDDKEEENLGFLILKKKAYLAMSLTV